MTGVTEWKDLAALAGTDRDHEAVRLDNRAVRCLDSYRPLHQDRSVGRDADDADVVGHGFTAAITASLSVRRPGSSLPVDSNHAARLIITGPNGIRWWVMESTRIPDASNAETV